MSTDVGRPSKAYVEPTNACNLACATCVRHSWNEPEGFMEWATFEAAVEGVAAGGIIAFMGLGEPCCTRVSSTWSARRRPANCARR